MSFGLPRGFLVGLVDSAKALLAGVSSSSLSKWPNQLSLLLLVVRDHGSSCVFLLSSSFDIFCGHLIPSSFLIRVRWKASTSFSSLGVKVHSSEL